MKCPYCGAEMKKGTLRGMNQAAWFPDDFKDPTLRDLLTWEGINTLCAPPRRMLLHTGESWDPKASWASARYCPGCHLFLFRGKVMEDKADG